jgi:hypothetical protein
MPVEKDQSESEEGYSRDDEIDPADEYADQTVSDDEDSDNELGKA